MAMRVVGGFVLLLMGITSLLGGSFQVLGGAAKTADGPAIVAKLSEAMEQDGRGLSTEVRRELETKTGRSGRALLVAGVITLLAGACSLVAGVLLLIKSNRAWFVLSAVALGIVAELVFWIGVGFYRLSLIKIGLYLLAGLSALWIGRRRPEPAVASSEA